MTIRTATPVGALSDDDLTTTIGRFEGLILNPATFKDGDIIVLVQRLCRECDTYREMAHGRIEDVHVTVDGQLGGFELRPHLSNGRGGYTYDINTYYYNASSVKRNVWFLPPQHAGDVFGVSLKRAQECTHNPLYTLCGADIMDGVEAAALRTACGTCEPKQYTTMARGRVSNIATEGRLDIVASFTLGGEEISVDELDDDTFLVPLSQADVWRSSATCTHP